MRALKALVIGMGLLIVLGLVVLIFAAVDRSLVPGESTPESSAKAPSATTLPKMARSATIELPPGAEVVETAVGDGRIVLRLRLPDGSGRLLLLDAASGEETGRMELRAR